MSLVLNEEQRLIKESARDFLQAHVNVQHFRQLREQQTTHNFTASTWQQIVDLGWPAMTIPEAYGGLGLGFASLGQIFEEQGQHLSNTPLFSNLVLCASAIELTATAEQQALYLPQIAQGQLHCAFAHDEQQRHQGLANIQCVARTENEHYVLNGTKSLVLDAFHCDKFLVSALTSTTQNEHANTMPQHTFSVFVVDAKQPGIRLEPITLLDGLTACQVHFDNVHCEAQLGETHTCIAAFSEVFDRGRAILAAEMLGGSLAAFQLTMEYIKQREQFDVKIGSFQALKHRSAQMFVQLELGKSSVLGALNAIDERSEERAKLCTLAKTLLNETFILVTDEATQMHGGIGVTDELDVGLYLKRARVYKQLLGDTSFLQNHYANLHEF